MKRTEVESRAITSAGWENGTLELEMAGGSVYHYDGVPQTVYEGMLTAPSIGVYFHGKIRHSYPSKLVSKG